MTKKLADQVARRLNELKVEQPDDPDHPLYVMVSRWSHEGGRLIVRDGPDGQIVDWIWPKVYRWEA